MSKSEGNLPAKDKDLCFLDVETTGAIIGFHEIIEIGVIRTCPSARIIRFRWGRRVAPLFPERTTPTARKINGFCEGEWTRETPSKLFWEGFVSRVADGVPVCHNPSFERAFISLAAAHCGVSDLCLDHHWIGTESLAWPLVKLHSLERFSLEGICQYLGIPAEPRPHSALAGADACLRLYQRLLEMHLTSLMQVSPR